MRNSLALVVALLSLAVTATAELLPLLPPERMVLSCPGYKEPHVAGGYWCALVADPADPMIQLLPAKIDADKQKFLVVKLKAESGTSMQVFFSEDNRFSEALSFRSIDLRPGASPVTYVFDLSGIEQWKGRVNYLRIDLDGAKAGSAVALHLVAVSDKRPAFSADERVVRARTVRSGRSLMERMAAWHETMVVTDEMTGASCVSTYVKERFAYWDSHLLAKLIAGVEIDGAVIGPSEAVDVKVWDIPGGVRAQYKLGGVKVSTEIVPLMVGRGTAEHEGGAVFSVSTEPRTPVVVRFGEGRTATAFERPLYLRTATVGREGDSATIDGGVTVITSTGHPLTVAATASAPIGVVDGASGGKAAGVRFANGSGTVLLGYASDVEQSKRIARMEHAAARKQVADYYGKLLSCRIETPEKTLDEGFRSALYNLEYNWLEPYGWNECIHHWLLLWHMQHTGAADWIGQADRSRMCNVTTASHLLPDGSAPQFSPAGATRKDFGGSNQFFAWQVRHHWRQTGDREFVKEILPALERVIEQTWREYDPDGDEVLAWGQQIGNQEDYVSTPFNGTSPAVEGANMLRTAAEFARALGQTDKAAMYERRAQTALSRLRGQLWQPDLGRFAFYVDPQGQLRPDGQYHTLIYPVIWGVLDPLDSYTSMRQMRERLIGEDGEGYCSNNFPNHLVCTCGMQGGAAQQPWTAWGLAAVGERNRTYRPLLAAAKWAMNADHRGSWPEISLETTPAYFSPPAGLFVQSTIEALFGLRVDRPAGCLYVSPSFPDSWPRAKLSLPDYSADYSRAGNRLDYAVHSATPLARKLRWMLPPCRVKRVLLNGAKCEFMVEPGVGCVILAVDTQPLKASRFQVEMEPLSYDIKHARSIAEGETLVVTVRGCRIEKIDDRCGVLSDSTLKAGELRAGVRTGLLDRYDGYGPLGRVNFSRRTFFLDCSAPGGVRFWAPVDIDVLPRYVCAQVAPSGLRGYAVSIGNGTSKRLVGEAILKVGRLSLPLKIDVAARSGAWYPIRVPENLRALLSPGENRAVVSLPGGDEVAFTLDASYVFGGSTPLADYAKKRIEHVALPAESMIEDTRWLETRKFTAYGHMPWAGARPPLEAVPPGELSVQGLLAVTFQVENRKFLPVSWKVGRPVLTIPLGHKVCKKVYLLVLPFLDNHDTFIAVARVDVKTPEGAVISRTLRSPGDLDWWNPYKIVGDMATGRGAKHGRWADGLMSDRDARPPAFPQPKLWASCLAYDSPSSLMNVVEIDLGRPVAVESLSVSVMGADPALGLVAVAVETELGQNDLQGTEWMPPAEFREPATLFEFHTAGELMGWTTEGAFTVASIPSLFTVPTLNSLAVGESATGKAVSPEFTIGSWDRFLTLRYHGGNSLANSGPGALVVNVVDAASGEVIRQMPANGSHVLREGRISLDGLSGRRVRLELIDNNTGSSYAWIGVRKVELSPK